MRRLFCVYEQIYKAAGASSAPVTTVAGAFFVSPHIKKEANTMPSNLNLDYYYGNEAEQYSFYRVPKTILTDPRYKGVSIEAKVLYGLLLDRMGLSVKNGWMDGERRVYIYFTQEDAITVLS